MPIPVFTSAIFEGLSSIPNAAAVLKLLPWVALLYFLKMYFQGASNRSERKMHSKVVMVTVGSLQPVDRLEQSLTWTRVEHLGLVPKLCET